MDGQPESRGASVTGIIVVNWNGAAETVGCLDSLHQLRRQAFRIYIVDNASTDGSREDIQRAHPEDELLVAPANLGYAGAFNLGWQQALADGMQYVWLLNNDTVVDPDALDKLVEADRRHGPAILSPKILFRDRPEILWYAGGYVDRALKSHHVGKNEADGEQYSNVREIPWASGCSLFCSRDVLAQVGAMYEGYFLYLEDVDWCYAARKRGVPTYYIPDARVYHGVSRTVSMLDERQITYYAWRNYYLLVRRQGTAKQRFVMYADLLSRFIKIGLRHIFFPSYRKNGLYRARTQALFNFVLGRFGSMPPLEDNSPSMAGRARS